LSLGVLFIIFAAPVTVFPAKIIENNYQIYMAAKLNMVFLNPKAA